MLFLLDDLKNYYHVIMPFLCNPMILHQTNITKQKMDIKTTFITNKSSIDANTASFSETVKLKTFLSI